MDELFLQWLALPQTPDLIRGIIDDVKRGRSVQPPSPIFSSKPTSPSSLNLLGSSPRSPPNKTPPRSPTSVASSLNFSFERPPKSPRRTPESSPTSGARSLQEFRKPLSASASHEIPRFYFPGKPSADQTLVSRDAEALRSLQARHPSGVPREAFGEVTAALGLPKLFAGPLFRKLDAQQSGVLAPDAFRRWWETEMQGADEETRFFRAIKQSQHQFIVPADFRPFLEELLHHHQGLAFLGPYTNFHDKYMDVVTYRIFYVVDRDDDGRITLRELKKSSLFKTWKRLEGEDDINNVREYFSYEHFYVLYCRFFELDTDQDFKIDREDFHKYDNHALCKRAVDRIFAQVPRKFKSPTPGKMTFEDFCWYLLSEEDKSSDRAIEYWFRVVDLDGDGVITSTEMAYFYEEQVHRLECLNHEAVKFPDVICQLNDMIHPPKDGEFRQEDLRRRRHHAGTFFNAIVNLNKFIAFETRDPFALKQELSEHPDWSDWDRFAAAEYARLAMEEEVNTQDSSDMQFPEDAGTDGVDAWDSSQPHRVSEAPF